MSSQQFPQSELRAPKAIRRTADSGDGPEVGFTSFRFTGEKPGPRVVVLGGVHGDELGGILAAGKLAASGLSLSRGTLEIVPIVHEAAATAGSREGPDGLNLARVMPGSRSGTRTERLASLLADEILTDADLLIDLHTGGRNYDLPFLVGYREGNDSAISAGASAAAFSPGYLWKHAEYPPGRTVSYVSDNGGVAIYTESPGGERADWDTVDSYYSGVLKVLILLDLISTVPSTAVSADSNHPITIKSTGDIDTGSLRNTEPGYFVTSLSAGEVIQAGDLIGDVMDELGTKRESLIAGHSGVLVLLRRRIKYVRTKLWH